MQKISKTTDNKRNSCRFFPSQLTKSQHILQKIFKTIDNKTNFYRFLLETVK